MGWERGWKKATDSRRHQYRAPPPLLGVCHLVQRGRVEKHKREGTPPLSKPLVKTEVMTEPYEDVKNFGWQPHTHTHTCRKSLVTQSGVTTEVDEDVKSLTAAIRLGGSETREERQQRECEMWTAEEVEWKRSLLVFSLSAGLLFLCRPNLLNSAQCLRGLECFCVRACLHVCSLHPERFHGCASFQRTCSVSSTAESSWTERGRGRDGNTEREMIERASGW